MRESGNRYLDLKYREVARENIKQVDKLGAFNRMDKCLYHDQETCCAIGVCDPLGYIDSTRENQVVAVLVREGIIRTDNLSRLQFIQSIHDYFLLKRQFKSKGTFSEFLHLVPRCVREIFPNCFPLTKEAYIEIMQAIADEP